MDEEKDVGREIRMLSNLLKREMDIQMTKLGFDRVTGMNGWILTYLSRHKERPVYQKDLERNFSVARSTVTSLVKLMEKKGLIERTSVESDARLKALKLTAKGEQVQQSAYMCMIESERRLCENISEQELEAFVSVAKKMRANLYPKHEKENIYEKGDVDD